MLRDALDRAKLGDPDKMEGLKRLSSFTTSIEERFSPEADFDAIVEHERKISPDLGGRTVFDDRGQLKLF